MFTFPLHSFGYYFIEPVIAMLDPLTGEPFVASCDNIGCPMVPKDFALTGTCNEELYGMCEQLWEPNLVCLLPLAFFSSVSSHSLLSTRHQSKLITCRHVSSPNRPLDIAQAAPELFETISQAMLNALDRDAGSGWGVTVYLLCVTLALSTYYSILHTL